MEIRHLRESDLSAAMRLARAEHWNQTERDWRLLLDRPSPGCFAAWSHAEVAGVVTTVTYGAKLGWIGMMVVRRARRGQGIGRSLMQSALQHLIEAGVEAIKLDATPAGESLYLSLGFLPERRVDRFVKANDGSAQKARAPNVPGLGALEALDLIAFGADRRTLLHKLINAPGASLALLPGASSGQISGFGLGRPGANADFIGPIVALNEPTAVRVLDILWSERSAKNVCIDWLAHDAHGAKCLTDRGFVVQRSLTRMSYGKPTGATISRCLFASAGPELG